MIQELSRYKSIGIKQLLKDLNWLVTSRCLIQADLPEFQGHLIQCLGDFVDDLSLKKWLSSMEDNPIILQEYFNSEEQLIVGKYYERLISFFFEHYPQFDVLFKGKQIFVEQRTIGELDFIIKDNLSQKVIHIEAAVKYYMGYKNVGKHDLWIGPNGLDTLQKKIRKLDKQLLLSDVLDFKIDQRIALMGGYFFKHWKSTHWPYFYENRDGEGIWMYEDEMNDCLNSKAYYSIIPKSNWLSFYIGEGTLLYDFNEIQIKVREQINTIGKGIMLAEVDLNSLNLIRKYIVAPLKWPRL